MAIATDFNASDRDRIVCLYAQKPGLTCTAIARRLNIDRASVCRCLGYPVPASPKRSTKAHTNTELQKILVRDNSKSCPHCGFSLLVKSGRDSHTGKQQLKCQNCGKKFFEVYERKGILIPGVNPPNP